MYRFWMLMVLLSAQLLINSTNYGRWFIMSYKHLLHWRCSSFGISAICWFHALHANWTLKYTLVIKSQRQEAEKAANSIMNTCMANNSISCVWNGGRISNSQEIIDIIRRTNQHWLEIKWYILVHLSYIHRHIWVKQIGVE